MKRELTVEIRVMDIALNLARVGNWTADSYDTKKNLIAIFVKQTKTYLGGLKKQQVSASFKQLLEKFEVEFQKLQSEEITPENKYDWAERALTWANILQHRAKLAY